MDILDRIYWENTGMRWLLALALSALLFLILNTLKRAMARRVLVWVKGTETDLDDFLVELFGRTWYLFLAAISIYVGAQFLDLPPIKPALRTIMVILFLGQAAVWSSGIVNYLIARHTKGRAETEGDTTAVNVLGVVAKAVLWTVAGLLALDNIPGVEVDSLIASLGIGGIAVALAVQNVLGDLFASLSIVLDEPFVVGDFITVGDHMGTVERVGLKSTRVRSLTGEQLVFSNSDLLNSRIRNYGRMDERRISVALGVTCETPVEKLVEIPGIVQEIIEAQPQTRFGRVHFKAYGPFSLDYEIVYFMLTSDYDVFMDTQQAINLGILRRFAEEGIELPYPTQTIFVAKPGGDSPT
jgi:small-conductance mechanosensitive channel